MTEHVVLVDSVANLFGLYKVEYLIPFEVSAIKGYICFSNIIVDRIPFQSSLHPRITRFNLMGERELPTFNLLVNSNYVISGCYTPQIRRVCLYLPRLPNLPYHWLVVYGEEAKICWMKEGF